MAQPKLGVAEKQPEVDNSSSVDGGDIRIDFCCDFTNKVDSSVTGSTGSAEIDGKLQLNTS